MSVERDQLREQVAELTASLDAAQETIAALEDRVEALDAGPPVESGAMARALAGMQRELARRSESLARTEATYRALYESTPDPLLTVDDLGVVRAANRTALVWLGLGEEETVGQPLAHLFDTVHTGELERLAVHGWTGVGERRFTLADGRRVSLNAAPIPGAARTSHHVTFRDITTRELLDEAQVERRRVAALAELAGAVARELNDPMSIVQGRLELLLALGEQEPAAVERHLSIALGHARRISATLRNLRLVGRTPAPRLDRVYVSEVVQDAAHMVGHRIRRVDFSVDLDPADLAVGGDAAMLTRVFANLLGWMLDVSPRGGRIEVRARRRPQEVVMYIEGGSGSAPVLPDEAEHFVAGGFGLSIAHTLVTTMGGQLDARRGTSGTLFTLTLPRPPAVRVRKRPTEERVVVVGSTSFGGAVRSLLERDGFEIVFLDRAEEALAALVEDEEIAAVITQLFLEGMSGLSLAGEALRRHAHLRGRVVLVTDARLPEDLPAQAVVLRPPLQRVELLESLGRRARRGR